MRKYIFAFAVIAALSLSLSSCSEEIALSDDSSIIDTVTPETEFDVWLNTNYLEVYNISYEYRYNDTLIDMEPTLVPADYEESILLAKLVRHLALEAYDELTGSTDFMREYFPKIIQLIGSPSYNADGSFVLGEAEGGKTMYLYDVNGLSSLYAQGDADALNDSYFHTMHHEFAHILHQTKSYSKEYETYSSSLYVGDNCFDTYTEDADALVVGFITPYSATNSDEDFVEILSTYVTNTQEHWDSLMAIAGTTGSPILTAKLDIIRAYLLASWDIDMDALREIILSRQETVWGFDTSLD